MDSERALFEAFILPSKKRRFLELLETKRGHDQLGSYLDHLKGLDPRLCQKIQASQHTPAGILRILESLGAPPTCHVISSNSNLDGRETLLSDVLGKIVSRGCGTFLSCIPGELAYFEDEEPGERYICRREQFARK